MRAVDRRTFCKLVGGGIVVLVTAKPTDLFAQQRRGYPEDLNAYLRIDESGRVTLFSGKIEMGQGVHTSLAQMAAEELGVSLDAITVVMGDTDQCPWDAGTWGSQSTRMFGPAVRAAAAEARTVMMKLASESNLSSRTASSPTESSPSATATWQKASKSPVWSTKRRSCAPSRTSKSSASRPSASTAATKSPAARSTPATRGCRGCSTRASSARPRTARRGPRSTPRRRRRWTASPSSSATTSWPCCMRIPTRRTKRSR